MSAAPLQQALDWWAKRDDMGGFRTVASELFPEWNFNDGFSTVPPYGGHHSRSFSIREKNGRWYFRDSVTRDTGSLSAFVMRADMDTDSDDANRWLMHRWANETGVQLPADAAPTLLTHAPASTTTNGNGSANSALTVTVGEGVTFPTTNSAPAANPMAEDGKLTASPAIACTPDAPGEASSPPRSFIELPAYRPEEPRAPFDPGAPQPWGDALGAAIVTSGELQTMQLPARPKLLGDWFCEGDLGFVYAFRGVGKTWLGLLMARALSEGGRLGEWQAPAPARTLYIDGEMPPDLMRQRDRGLTRGSASGNLEFLNHEILFRRTHRVMNITHSEVQLAILEHCERSGVKVLILDNLSTLASGMKENDADDWDMVGRWLLDFRRRQIAVVVIHHAGRNGEMRGTTKREDDAGWIVALDDARQAADDRRGARFISRFSKQTRNTPEEVPPYEWHICPDMETGAITVKHKLATGVDLLRKLIEDGVTDCTELSEELRVSKGTVSKWAHRGILDGWLTKEGRGYALV